MSLDEMMAKYPERFMGPPGGKAPVMPDYKGSMVWWVDDQGNHNLAPARRGDDGPGEGHFWQSFLKSNLLVWYRVATPLPAFMVGSLPCQSSPQPSMCACNFVMQPNFVHHHSRLISSGIVHHPSLWLK